MPARKKMTDPKYRGIEKKEIPVVQRNGVKVKVLSGKIDGTVGPVGDLSIDIEYFDVELVSGKIFEYATPQNRTVFAYVVSGSIEVQDKTIKSGFCAVFSEGDLVRIGSKKGARFLFVMGEPLKEPVAWRGPIVMNTQEELNQAFEELDEGTFIKTVKPTKSFRR